MGILQTFGDINRQTVRKMIDIAAGAAVSAGVIDQSLMPIVVGIAVAIANAVWWWIDNRNKVTVKGLEESNVPGTSDLAAQLAKKLRDAKSVE